MLSNKEPDEELGREVRIVLADDHPVVRKGLRMAIEEDPELKVISEAGDGEAALAMIGRLRPDVAVLDIDMPKLDGFGVARKMREQKLKSAIIFLTLHTADDYFHEAMELGAKGYVLKDSAMQEIVAGVRAAAAGRPYLSSAITSRMLKRRGGDSAENEDSLIGALTPTEREILKLVGAGRSSKEIADDLGIHYRTVENHRTNMCRKLGLEGANALLRFALQRKSALENL